MLCYAVLYYTILLQDGEEGSSSHLRDLDSSVLEDGLSLSEAASTVRC